MLPVISVPGTYSAYSANQAGLASIVAASEVAVGRLPAASIAPTVMLPELNNNSRGNSGGRPPLMLPSSASPAPQPFSPGLASRISEPTLNLGTSTLFLAQLFGQSDTAVSITGNTSQFVDYSTFVQYGLVKYKPSNAAMVQFSKPEAPVAEPSPGEQIRIAARQAAQQLENLTASRQAVQAPAATSPTTASTAMVQNAPSQIERPEQREARMQVTQRASSRGGASASMVRQRGVEAYMATFARNYANLNTPVSKPEIAASSAL